MDARQAAGCDIAQQELGILFAALIVRMAENLR
jgi:hypothetical protein